MCADAFETIERREQIDSARWIVATGRRVRQERDPRGGCEVVSEEPGRRDGVRCA